MKLKQLAKLHYKDVYEPALRILYRPITTGIPTQRASRSDIASQGLVNAMIALLRD